MQSNTSNNKRAGVIRHDKHTVSSWFHLSSYSKELSSCIQTSSNPLKRRIFNMLFSLKVISETEPADLDHKGGDSPHMVRIHDQAMTKPINVTFGVYLFTKQ